MLEEIKTLIQEKDICVLATVAGGEPHCSLMSYVTGDDCREFFMITRRDTKKFRNLLQNETVSLLIDTREEDVGQRRKKIRALTVSGAFQIIENREKASFFRDKLLATHPQLQEFADSDDAQVFCIRARSFQLLRGVSQSHFEVIE